MCKKWFASLVLPSMVALLACGPLACGGARGQAVTSSSATIVSESLTLRDDTGNDASLGERVSRSRLSVLLFFSSDCPVQKAHDGRIRELVRTFGDRGVSFYAIASDIDSDIAVEREAVKQRGLGIQVLEDKNAAVADALGVEYSTHAIVLDRDRHVLYSGAIDSDRTRLSPRAEFWLHDAIDASLRGMPVAKTNTEPLGCPIRKH